MNDLLKNEEIRYGKYCNGNGNKDKGFYKGLSLRNDNNALSSLFSNGD